MIIKKFKLKKDIVNILRYKSSLEERGWSLVVDNADYWLEPIITKKILSTCFTIFFLQKVLLVEVDQKLLVKVKVHPMTLIINSICLLSLFTWVYVTGDLSFYQLVIAFVYSFSMLFFIMFFSLRSELVDDIKKCIIVKL